MDLIRDSYISFLNLEHRKDRLEHMQLQLNRIGVDAIRTLGRKPNEYDLSDPKVQVMLNRTPGAIGCHFGQIEIMKKAHVFGKHAFVMEDDLIFCEDFKIRLKCMGDFLGSRDWDVMWLGATFHSPAFWHPEGSSKMPPDCSAHLGKDFEHTEDPHFKKTYGAFCTYAYIVNHTSIEKILSLFDEHLHTSIGIDWLFIKLQPKLNCFAFVPGSVKQMDNQSDIGNGITMFSGFSRLNGTEENSKYWYQNLYHEFDPNTFAWK